MNLLITLQRTCGTQQCNDTMCKSSRCLVFELHPDCKKACQLLCQKHSTKVSEDGEVQEFQYRCHLLDTGKIVAITFAVVILASCIVIDILLYVYCHKKFQMDDVVNDTEIGGVKMLKSQHRLQIIRQEIEDEIEGRYKPQQQAEEINLQGIIELQNQLQQQAIQRNDENYYRSQPKGVITMIQFYDNQFCEYQ